MKIECLTKLKPKAPPPKKMLKFFFLLWDDYPNLPFWSLISDVQGVSSFTTFSFRPFFCRFNCCSVSSFKGNLYFSPLNTTEIFGANVFGVNCKSICWKSKCICGSQKWPGSILPVSAATIHSKIAFPPRLDKLYHILYKLIFMMIMIQVVFSSLLLSLEFMDRHFQWGYGF